MPRIRGARRLLIIAALGATLAVPLLLGGGEALAATLHFPAQAYAALLGLMLASWLARAAKLHLLLHKLNVRPAFAHTFGISLATELAFITTPAGVGGYVATLYYLRRAGTSVSGAATITAVDQGLDLVFFALSVPLAALALLHSDLPHALTAIAFGTSAVMLLLAACAFLARRKVAAWLFGANVLTTCWPALRQKQEMLHKFCASLSAHASELAQGGPTFLFSTFALTAMQWLTRYGILWLALLLLGHHVPFALAFLLQVLVLHAALWTGVPAGGGGAELGLTATLAPWVPSSSLATALLLWRSATLYTSLIAGAAAVALLAHGTRRRDGELRVDRGKAAESVVE